MDPEMSARVTYSQAQWQSAQDAWSTFSSEWDEWRRLAASGPGIIWPPEGTDMDSWADEHPSQRAMVIRAIRETPDLLRWALKTTTTPSWHVVISKLLDGRDEWRDMEDAEAERDRRRRAEVEPTDKQAVYALKEILTIIQDS